MRRWWLPCFLALALASPLAVAQGTATGSPPSASSDSSRSNGSETPTSPSSGTGQPAPQSPTEAFETLESEWLAFTEAWDKFYLMLEALGIELGELPSYLASLEKSLKDERDASKAERDAYQKDLADKNMEIEDLEKRSDILFGTSVGLGGVSVLLVLMLIFR